MTRSTPDDRVIWLDGKIIPWDQANVHVLTHTLHYGLGVFEGLRAYGNERHTAIFRLQDHTDRFYNSAKILNIKIPYSKGELNQVQQDIVLQNKLQSAYIRPLCFLSGDHLSIHTKGLKTHVMIAAWKWKDYHGKFAVDKGLRVKFSTYLRNTIFARSKACGNYMASILALQEAQSCGYDEALMMDAHGFVSEATGANFFMVKDDVIYTPTLISALPGITRDTVMVIARQLGFRVIEKQITRGEVYTADEAFLTGSAAEIVPISEIDEHVIGDGSMGLITQQIRQSYFEHVQGDGNYKPEWLTIIREEPSTSAATAAVTKTDTATAA